MPKGNATCLGAHAQAAEDGAVVVARPRLVSSAHCYDANDLSAAVDHLWKHQEVTFEVYGHSISEFMRLVLLYEKPGFTSVTRVQ